MENINRAFSEVYDIIQHFDIEMFNKIPKKFLLFLKENKDDSYITKIDYKLGINNQKLLQDTRVILSLVYRDYLCSDEKKQELIEKDKAKIKRYAEVLNKKYKG